MGPVGVGGGGSGRSREGGSGELVCRESVGREMMSLVSQICDFVIIPSKCVQSQN
jgi:hypothetical protein